MKSIKAASLPRLIIEEGAFESLPGLISSSGYRDIGIIHGRSVYTLRGEGFRSGLQTRGISFREVEVRGEPSPKVVDGIVSSWSQGVPELIVAVGGGSVLDAAKAVAAMLAEAGGVSVKEYLEGVGTREPTGRTLPVFAVPSTAGTGSEATKNAVLSEIGGFKKSLRHDNYVPRLACIDPALAAGAPLGVSASAGLDAVTQLLEAYFSTQATPFTDALALSGLEAAGRGFPVLLKDLTDIEARGEMGYAAYLSGVVLANAGLGVIHGAASPLGAARSIPHGVVCGLLLPGTVRRIILRAKAESLSSLVRKLEEAAGALGTSLSALPDLLDGWLSDARLSGFASYGFEAEELTHLAEATGLKNSPVLFSTQEIRDIFLEKL